MVTLCLTLSLLMTMEKAAKRTRRSPSTSDCEESATACFREVQGLLMTTTRIECGPSPRHAAPIGNCVDRLKAFLDNHGFRTTLVQSPRKAVSIYRDSCAFAPRAGGCEEQEGDEKRALLAMLGTHPLQDVLEQQYRDCFRQVYCLWLFCQRIREVCSNAVRTSADLVSLLDSYENDCLSIGDKPNGRGSKTISDMMEQGRRLSSLAGERVAQFIKAILNADPRIRPEQLQHEYQRISWHNTTYANAQMQQWLKKHNICIKEVYYKHSHVDKYQRYTVHVYDPSLDHHKPPTFVWMPCLSLAIQQGPEAIGKAMVHTFWGHLLRRGYFATPRMQHDLSPELEKYFRSGISNEGTTTLLLNAHFHPTYPLCYYFCGRAGSGKSSLVRNFSYALHSTLEDFVDAEIMVRSVKQNLNKQHDVLQLEFELRPNNNDLSVMSIIQGRRLTMGQSKPGLVVVDLEEMASNRPNADPNQLAIAQLISQRFAGKKGQYQEGAAPRNSANRGISGDASVIPLFTSNYTLEKPCFDTLSKLHMFSNLKVIEMEAISGSERKLFTKEYLRQAIQDLRSDGDSSFPVQVDLLAQHGDTRPLVRLLRMLAFYASALLRRQTGNAVCEKHVRVSQMTGSSCKLIVNGEEMLLKVTPSKILVPFAAQVFDMRVSIMKENLKSCNNAPPEELLAVLEFWLARTLAPAVIVSRDRGSISNIRKALEGVENVHCIPTVDASQYKMMKSLYDPNDTPNLRDDILKLGRGALVAVELICGSADAQHCVREIVEDTPSMTAFSTEKSALHKSGLLFCCYCAEPITPEIESRASLIL